MTAWLIELRVERGPLWVRCAGSAAPSDFELTADANAATRFGSQADAEACIAAWGLVGRYVATEHKWE